MRHTLEEFGDVVRPTSPMTVRPAAIRRYVQWLKHKVNAVSTVNKKLRYLRLAFNHAIDLDYAASNPLAQWTWQKPKKHQLRILQPDEEIKLLASCRKLYGDHLEAFVLFVLETWGRLSEATGLLWADVDFDDRSVLFLDTKSGEDRYVPIARESHLGATLRTLQARTMQDGGPFAIYRDSSNLHKKWKLVVKDAGIPHITIHDLRRTGITRALLANESLVTVQELAGHKSIETTRRYYVKVSKADKRAAVQKRHASSAG